MVRPAQAALRPGAPHVRQPRQGGRRRHPHQVPKGPLHQIRGNALHHQRKPMVHSGSHHQRRRRWRRAASVHQRRKDRVGAHVTQLGINVAVHRQQQHEGAGALFQGHHQRRRRGHLLRRSTGQLAIRPDVRRHQLLTLTLNGAVAHRLLMATMVTNHISSILHRIPVNILKL